MADPPRIIKRRSVHAGYDFLAPPEIEGDPRGPYVVAKAFLVALLAGDSAMAEALAHPNAEPMDFEDLARWLREVGFTGRDLRGIGSQIPQDLGVVSVRIGEQTGVRADANDWETVAVMLGLIIDTGWRIGGVGFDDGDA